MENRPFGQEEQDDSTPEASVKKKRGGSKLSRYLSGLRRKEHENSSETTTDDEKPKRLRRIFSRLLPRLVEKPGEATPESKEYDFDPEAWFGITRFASREESAKVSHPEEADTPTPTPEQPINASNNETGEVAANSLETEATEPETAFASESITPVANSQEAAAEIDSDTVEPKRLSESEGELYIREQERAEVSPAIGSSQEVTKEIVIERGSGLALPVALVGLEHLGRKKADKKLEQRLNEKITATDKEVASSVALQQELATLRRQNNEQLDALKRARETQSTESTHRTPETVKSNPIARSERIANPEKPKYYPEKLMPLSEAREQLPPPVERQVTKEEIQLERILEQVADAAEHDIPVERVFERSHEVKDDKTVVGTAASVGAVVSSHAAASQYQAMQQAKQPGGISPGLLPFVSDPVASAAYKQAVKMGFWAAMMIIILGSIAYLVVK